MSNIWDEAELVSEEPKKDIWAEAEEVQQPQPKNVVPNRPANQELKVQEQPQELNPNAQPSATQLQGGVEKKYVQQDGYIVDTETGEKFDNSMEIRKPDDLTSLSPKQLKNYLRSQEAIKRAANWERLHNAIPALIRDYEFLTPIFKQEEQYQATHPQMDIKDQITQRLKGMAGSVPGLVNIGLLGKTWGMPSLAKQGAIVGAGLGASEPFDKALSGEGSWWNVPIGAGIGALSGGVLGKGLQYGGKVLNQIKKNPAKFKQDFLDEFLPEYQRGRILEQKSKPLTQRIYEKNPQKLEELTNPNSYENMSMEQLEQATNPYNNMTMEELEKATAPDINYEPSTYGVNNNNIDSQTIANQFNTGINKARNEIQTFTDFANNLKAKYGSIDNLRKIVAEDVDEFGKPKSQFEAQMDLDNYLRMQEELANSNTPYLEQAGQIDKRFKQLDNAVEVPQNANKYVEPVVDPQLQTVAQPVVPQTSRVVATPAKQQPIPFGKKERSFGSSKYDKKIQEARTDAYYDETSRAKQKADFEALSPDEQQALINNPDAMTPEAVYGKTQSINDAVARGEVPSESIVNNLAQKGTEYGQALEAYKNIVPTTPSDIIMEVTKQGRKKASESALKLIDNANKIVNELNNIKVPDKQKAIQNIFKDNGIVSSLKTQGLAKDLLKLEKAQGLTPDNFIKLVQEKYKINTVKPDEIAKVKQLCDNFANATTDIEKERARAYIGKFLNKKIHRGFWETAIAKEKAWTYNNMLSNLQSRISDATATITNATGYGLADDIIANLSSKVLGTGTHGSLGSLNPKKLGKNFIEGVVEKAKDVNAGINTKRLGQPDRYDIGNAFEFEGIPGLEQFEKGVRHLTGDVDAGIYNSKYLQSLEDLKAAGFTEEEAKQIALEEALRRVWQYDHPLTKGIVSLVKGADKYTGPVRLGTRFAPFVRTMTNLTMDALQRGTGYDAAAGVAKIIKGKTKGATKKEMRDAVNQLSRGITGLGEGYIGGNLLLNHPNTIGGISQQDTYGDDVTGLGPQSIAIGDKGFNLSMFPTLTIPALINASMRDKNSDVPTRVINTVQRVGNTIAELPGIKSFGDLYKSYNSIQSDLQKLVEDGEISEDEKKDAIKSVNSYLGPQLANMLSQEIFASSLINAGSRAYYPANTETYNPNDLGDMIYKKVTNRTPWRKDLPVKYNALGEVSLNDNIQNPVARALNELVTPIKVSNYNPAKTSEKLKDFAKSVKGQKYEGANNIILKKLPRSLKINNEKIVLGPEQYSEMQKTYGQLQSKYKQQVLDDTYNDEIKTKRLAEIRKSAEEAIKIHYFNHKPKSSRHRYTNRMINDIKNGDL